MLRILSTSLLFFSSLSIAIDKPNSHQLYNEGVDKSFIGMNCSAVRNDGSILCDFSQNSLSYKLDPANLKYEIVDIKKKLEAEDLSKISVDDYKKQLCPNDEKFMTKENEINAMSEGYTKAYSKKLYAIILKSCNLKTKKEILSLTHELLSLEAEKNATTCKVISHNWSEVFFPKINGDSSYWLAQSEGEGECGMKNISTLKSEDKYFWRYQSKRIITNKNGNGIIPCNKFEERDVTYSWKAKEYDISCKLFKFGF